MALSEQAFDEGALLTPPFKGGRAYVAAADILRAVEAALRPEMRLKGRLIVEFRHLVDGGLQFVAGQRSDAPVRLRWADEAAAQYFSLERATAGVLRGADCLPPYALASGASGDVMTLTGLGGHANLFECVVDAGKRLLPAPNVLSQWMVRSVELHLSQTPQPWTPYTLSREALRGGLMRWHVDDLEGRRLFSVVSVLVQSRPALKVGSNR